MQKRQQPDKDFEKRYHRNWSKISLLTRELTNHTCCFPRCTKTATSTHHALYFDKEGEIAGREIPGVHGFPLCDEHHSKKGRNGAHNWRNWMRKTKDPVLGNRNTASYYKKLRQGWLEKCIN